MKKRYYVLLLFSCLACEVLFVEDISSNSVLLLAPKNNSSLDSGNIKFSWELLNEANQYQVQIATPNFSNAHQILLDSITTKNSLLKSLKRGAYEWRVKAMNSEYETPYNTVSFQVK